MPHDGSELVTIGEFSRLVGVTPSALRYYDDCGLLAPAHTSADSGYRFYATDQRHRGVVIRILREAGLSLAEVRQVVDGSRGEVRRIIDEHLARNAEQARKAAAALRQALQVMLGPEESYAQVSVAGPELASGIRQVHHATARPDSSAEPGSAVALTALSCVQVELDVDEVRLITTDRYRLALRSLRGRHFEGDAAQIGVAADDLLQLASDLLLADTVVLRVDGAGLTCTFEDQRHVLAGRPGAFPDYRLLLDDIAPADAKLVVDRGAFLEVLRSLRPRDLVLLTASEDGAAMVARPWAGDSHRLAGAWIGPRFQAAFGASHLEEAVATGVGPDVIIELADGPRPAVVRSADHGSFTTLVMPRRYEPAGVAEEDKRHGPGQPGDHAVHAGNGGRAGTAAG